MTASTYPRWRDDPEPSFVHELARRLTSRLKVVVLCPHAPGAKAQESLDGVTVVRYRYAPGRFETLVQGGGISENLKRTPWKWLLVPAFVVMQLLILVRLIWVHRPAVVQAHWIIPQGMVAALAAVLAPRSSLLVTSHGVDLFAFRSGPMRALKTWVLKRAAAVTVVSHAMLEELASLRADMRKVRVMPMGVDFDTAFVSGGGILRADNELLFVGRLVEKKGLLHLIEALPLVRKQWPTVGLTIIGSGPLEGMARELAARLAVADCVRFLGAMPQHLLAAHYRSATMLVAPFIRAASGDQEGLGLVVAEALGCECPVVVGDVPSMKDLGLHGVEVRDPVQLSEAILAVQRMSSDDRRAYAAEGRTRCVALLDWSVAADRYEQLLIDLSSGQP